MICEVLEARPASPGNESHGADRLVAIGVLEHERDTHCGRLAVCTGARVEVDVAEAEGVASRVGEDVGVADARRGVERTSRARVLGQGIGERVVRRAEVELAQLRVIGAEICEA